MIGRKSTLAYANMGVGILLGLAAGKLIALYTGEEPLGQLTFAMGVLGLLFFVTDLGMGQAHVKRVSEGRDPGDCFATFAVFKAVSTLAFVLLASAGLFVFVGVLDKPLVSTTLPVLVGVLVYFVAKSLQEVGQSSFDARLETARSQLTLFLDTVVRSGLSIVAALVYAALVHGKGPLVGAVPDSLGWIQDDPGLALTVATAAGAVVAATASLVMLFRALERGRFSWPLLKDYASFALPLFLTSAASIISAYVDAATLGYYWGAHEVGVFGGVRRIVGVLSGIALPVSVLLFPTLSSLAARGDAVAIQRTMDRSIRYLSMLVVPICAFTAVFAETLIRLFLSEPFVEGAPALAVFCAYVVLVTLATPHINLVLGRGHSPVAARIGLGIALTVIVLNLVLVPQEAFGLRLGGLGIMGSAIATFASGVVYYVSARYATWRLAGYRERGHVWRHLLASAVMCGVLLAVHAWALPFARWYDVVLYVPLGMVAYALSLWVLRDLTTEDVRYVRESLHPLEMLRYLRHELRRKR